MNITVINQIIILTLMMFIGVILRKLKIISDEVNKGLTSILMNLTLPCMILYSFNFTFSLDMFRNALIILMYSTAIHIILIILSKIAYFKFDDNKEKVFKFSTIFSNCGFVGFPIVQGIFGDIGVFYTSIFTIPFNIFMWTYGVVIFTGEKNIKSIRKNLVNPPLICTVIGMLIFLFSIKLPQPVISTLSSIGNMTTPISMFIVGTMLADVKIKDVFKGIDIYYMNIVKLIVSPLIILTLLKLLHADDILMKICVIMVAMPTASLVGVFSEKYNGDRPTASRCAFLTTVLSLITIPVIMSVI